MLPPRGQYLPFVFLPFALLLVACGVQGSPAGAGGPDAAHARLRIATTVSPITNIVYNIVGGRAEITGIVPEGMNSHTYEPAPSVARTLAEADLIFLNGLGLEEPALRLAEANRKEGAEIVLLGDRTVEPDGYAYDFSFPREAGSPNPHLWPNPMYALRYAGIARDTLAARDPENARYYRRNYAAFAERIAALDAAIARTVGSIPKENRKLLTYHDSFAYFAPRYGMEVIGAIQPADFSEPSPREVARLIDQLKRERAPAVFGSEVFPSPVLERIASEADVRFVDDLRDDDLPGAPGEKNHSYVGLMRRNLEIMAGALGGDPALMGGVDTSNVPGPDINVDQPQ